MACWDAFLPFHQSAARGEPGLRFPQCQHPAVTRSCPGFLPSHASPSFHRPRPFPTATPGCRRHCPMREEQRPQAQEEDENRKGVQHPAPGESGEAEVIVNLDPEPCRLGEVLRLPTTPSGGRREAG